MQPTPYTPSYNFTAELASSTGTHLDTEFAAVSDTLQEIIDNLALIQRDDGNVRNQTVHGNAFTSDALALIASTWTPRGNWTTATAYVVGDLVEYSVDGKSYVCATAHTAGAFATDKAAAKWVVVSAPRTIVSSDVTGALGYTPVNKAGDTMTGALTLPTGSVLAGITYDTTYLTTQDLGRIDKGLYSVYTSAKNDIIYGFASNVVRSAGAYFTVASQFSGYGTAGAGSSVWGGNINAIGLSGFAHELIGLEVDVASYDSNNTATKIGIDFVFLNRNTGTTAGGYSYTFPQGTYSNAGSGLGGNQYNRNAMAMQISSQESTSAGEYCGWARAMYFAEYSLAPEYNTSYTGNIAYPIGIDFSNMHYYGGSDTVLAYKMEAAIALRDLQAIWWNRDPSTAPTTNDKCKTFFDGFVGRWVLHYGNTEKFGIDVNTGEIYLNGAVFNTAIVSLSGTNVWTALNTFNGGVTLGSNLTFTGTRRITGDFSNATAANRTIFQTSTPNGATELTVIPAGASTSAAITLISDSNAANGAVGRIACDSANMAFSSTGLGSGSAVPMTFVVGTERMRIATSGGISIGTVSAPISGASLRLSGMVQVDQPVAFSAHRGGVTASVATGTFTSVQCNTEEFDTNNSYNTGTYRFTPPAGKYVITGNVTFQGINSGQRMSASIYKNGVAYKSSHSLSSALLPISARVSVVVDANGTDYFELYCWHDSGVNRTLEGNTTDTYFCAHRIG